MITYKVSIIRYTEKDDFNNGCLPETFRDYGIIHKITKKTLTELINEIESFCDGKAYLFDGENNRIEVQVLENLNGYKASNEEIVKWKSGKYTLLSATYSCYISKIIENEDVLTELKELNLDTI